MTFSYIYSFTKNNRVVAYLIQETFMCEASHVKFAPVCHQIVQVHMYENVTYGPSQLSKSKDGYWNGGGFAHIMHIEIIGACYHGIIFCKGIGLQS